MEFSRAGLDQPPTAFLAAYTFAFKKGAKLDAEAFRDRNQAETYARTG